MTIRPFTAEGRFECGLDAIVAGKTWAFVAVVGEHNPVRLGVAIANEPGYTPIPEHWAHGDDPADYGAFMEHADALNLAEGMTIEEATRIVASTMVAQAQRRRAQKRATMVEVRAKISGIRSQVEELAAEALDIARYGDDDEASDAEELADALDDIATDLANNEPED